ncbi:MAG: extracellular solute-binding protein [Clostridia bacterium]|nr:extracellular solute-binding protein [Clostridia bacterium]
MKKIIALLCVVAMMVSLSSCGGPVEETSSVVTVEGGGQQNGVQGENGDNSEAGSSSNGSVLNSSGSNTKIDNPLNVDLKGATITIYDISTFNPNASASKTEKAKADMLNKIQKELNCKFKVTTTTDEKMESYVTTSAASGKALCGIIAPSMYNSGYYISANLVTNLTKVSSMDLSKSYMNRYGILSASQFGSAKYAVAAEGESRTYVVFYNKRILKEMGYSENHIYNLVDSGKWTYDVYRELAKKGMKDLDGKAGFSANDQWGQVLQDGSTGIMSNVVAAQGTSMLKLSSSGKLTYNMTDARIINSINLAHNILVKDGTDSSKFGSTADDRVKMFGNGKALFLFASLHKATNITGMKDDYGIVPVPQTAATKNYKSSIDWNARVLMMPAGLSAKDQYNAGAVMQAYQYLYDNVLKTMETEYVNRYFCDEKSGDNFKIAAAGMTTMPEFLYAQTNETILSGTYRIFWDYFNGKTNSPVSNIEAQKSAVEKSLEELNSKIKDK